MPLFGTVLFLGEIPAWVVRFEEVHLVEGLGADPVPGLEGDLEGDQAAQSSGVLLRLEGQIVEVVLESSPWNRGLVVAQPAWAAGPYPLEEPMIVCQELVHICLTVALLMEGGYRAMFRVALWAAEVEQTRSVVVAHMHLMAVVAHICWRQMLEALMVVMKSEEVLAVGPSAAEEELASK